MPWCPKCDAEYIEGFKVCKQCNVELVEKFEPEIINNSSIAFLLNVSNIDKADVVESMLNSYEIPVLKKHRETGSYLNIYMGMADFGTDIYVPNEQLELARDIIENKGEELEKQISEMENKDNDCLYVPKEQLEKAGDVIENKSEELKKEIFEIEKKDTDYLYGLKYFTARRNKVWLIIAFWMVIPVLMYFLYFFFLFFSRMFLFIP